jgi:ferritin-like metal-binding protein YciE
MEHKSTITMQNLAKPVSWSNFLEVRSPLVDLFIGSIKEAYWAENHLVRTLLKLMNASSSGGLKYLLNFHIERTKIHSTKLEHIFELLDENIDARRNDSVAGLSTEANEMIEYTDEGSATRDLGVILICQKIEQYEIATYQGLIKLSATIGRADIASLFGDILEDETECLEYLTNECEIITLKAADES